MRDVSLLFRCSSPFDTLTMGDGNNGQDCWIYSAEEDVSLVLLPSSVNRENTILIIPQQIQPKQRPDHPTIMPFLVPARNIASDKQTAEQRKQAQQELREKELFDIICEKSNQNPEEVNQLTMKIDFDVLKVVCFSDGLKIVKNPDNLAILKKWKADREELLAMIENLRDGVGELDKLINEMEK
jgi:hypothetical protein